MDGLRGRGCGCRPDTYSVHVRTQDKDILSVCLGDDMGGMQSFHAFAAKVKVIAGRSQEIGPEGGGRVERWMDVEAVCEGRCLVLIPTREDLYNYDNI